MGYRWGRTAKSGLMEKVNAMRIVLIALIFLFGLFDLLMAIGFLLNPVQAAAGLGMTVGGAQELSSVRADFTAFFGVTAVCMMLGAWRRNGDLLLVPAALLAIAFIGRTISAAINGTSPGFFEPMIVEALQVVLLGIGWKVIPHHTIDELTG